MSDLSIKAMQFAERLKDGPYVHLKDTRDLLTECSDQLDAYETHEAMLNETLDDKDALISELVGALEPFANFGEYIHLETEGFSGGDEFELMIGNHLMERFKVTDFDKALSALTKAREIKHG